MKLTILTFNWHEPYLELLSRTENKFLVVEPEISHGKHRRWNTNLRPCPENVKIISIESALETLEQGEVDLVIAHNVKDLKVIQEYQLPKIMVFHNRFSTERALSDDSISREKYIQQLNPLLQGVKNVFISPSKKADWRLPGEVILPGIDLNLYGNYSGKDASILRVGNMLKERDLTMGFSASETISAGFSLVTLGDNPTLADSHMSEGLDDLLENYRTNRLYLNTTVDEFEDGYNLAMLEAMATGMPVITTANKTSPIQDGFNGYISDDIQSLRNSVQILLNNAELARKMGERARQTVELKFSMENFLESWSRVMREALLDFLEASGVDLSENYQNWQDKPKKNILMRYVSYPGTTAYYLERALRKHHNVITCGPMISDEIMKQWRMRPLNQKVEPQNIHCAGNAPLAEILRQLPIGWKPDLFLWVETGLDSPTPDLQNHEIPKACYLIDTHLHTAKHKQQAKLFDYVFLAQKKFVAEFQEDENQHVSWLPLACDPEIHGRVENVEKEFDVGFVGTVTASHERRLNLLTEIQSNFHLRQDRKFLREMAEIYSKSKIVFNNAIDQDLNMRVFEALCSGSMLVTDRASGSGLEELFKDGKHFVLYEDDSLIKTIRHYLQNPNERELIAEEGRKWVIANHTYGHRTEQMLQTISTWINKENVNEKPASYYENIRNDVITLVPKESKFILEVGCGAGKTGAALKTQLGAFVAGIEMNSAIAERAKDCLDDVLVGNIEKIKIPYDEQSFDCVIFADVLEHLIDPLAALKKIRKLLKPDGSVVASIPNVQYWAVVQNLVEGNWTYEKEGILDATHLRFFTFKEIQKLFIKAGFTIDKVEETMDPAWNKLNGKDATSLKLGRLNIENLSPEEIRRFFVFQYCIVARPVKIESAASLVSDHSPTSEQRMHETASSLISQGFHNEGIDLLFTALRSNIENMDALNELLLHCKTPQHLSELEINLKKYLEVHPVNIERLADLGQVQWKLNQHIDLLETIQLIRIFDTNNKKANQLEKFLQQHQQNQEPGNLFSPTLH